MSKKQQEPRTRVEELRELTDLELQALIMRAQRVLETRNASKQFAQHEEFRWG